MGILPPDTKSGEVEAIVAPHNLCIPGITTGISPDSAVEVPIRSCLSVVSYPNAPIPAITGAAPWGMAKVAVVEALVNVCPPVQELAVPKLSPTVAAAAPV